MPSAYLFILLSVIIWGSNFVAGSWLVQFFHPLLLAEFRLLIASVFLFVYALLSHRLVPVNWRQGGMLALIAFTGILFNQSFFFQSLVYVSATEAALIMSLAPLATALLAFLFLREPVTLRMLLGSLFAVFGVYLLVAFGKPHGSIGRGDLMAFAAMLSFAASMILTRQLSQSMDSFVVTVYGTVLGTAMFLPVTGWAGPHLGFPHTPGPWVVAILSALLALGVGGLMWNRGMTQVGAAKASIMLNLQPFVAMIVGYLVLGLPITRFQVIGGTMIIGGVIMATLHIPSKKLEKMKHVHFPSPLKSSSRH